jgi:PD-(D/E)XK endonuclease
MRDTSGIGEVSTVQVIAALVRTGKTVWTPFGDTARRADILMEDEHGIHRVQCKTGRIRLGCVLFKTASVHRKPGGGFEHRSYSGQIEFFGVYCPDNEKCCLIPISKTARGQCYLRLEAPKTCKTTVRWAHEFEISASVVQ